MGALVAQAQAGNESAFSALVSHHREQIKRLVVRMIGPHPDVEDVTQEVFVQVFRSLKAFRGESKFSTWLYRIAVNVTKMHLRKKKSRVRLSDAPAAPTESDDRRTSRYPAEGSPAPDAIVERNRRVEALYRIVQALPEKKRTVLVLHDFEGMAPAAIAEVVEAPVMTVRTRLFYARKALYAAMAEDEHLAASVPLEKSSKGPSEQRLEAQTVQARENTGSQPTERRSGEAPYDEPTRASQ